MNTRTLVEAIAAVTMLVGLAATFALRFRLRKGVGRRAIQALSVILVVPTTLILALEGLLNSETVAAILGGVVGYGLGGIGARENE